MVSSTGSTQLSIPPRRNSSTSASFTASSPYSPTRISGLLETHSVEDALSLVVWWLAGVWLAVAHVLALTVVGAPVGIRMYGKLPRVVSLYRY